MLSFPFVLKLHEYAKEVANRHEIALSGVILTNGTLLTEESLQEVRVLGLKLMISLDNLPSPSSRGLQRMYRDGAESASAAMHAIEMAAAYGITPAISLSVTEKNVDYLPQTLAWILERDLPFYLNFYREHPCATTHKALRCDTDYFVSGMLKAYKTIEENLPRRSLLASLTDLTNFSMPHVRRCSVGRSYLAIDSDGKIAKCQMQIDKPVTSIQDKDPLATILEDRHGIQNLPVDEKEGCEDCKWKFWCAGGCPLESYRATGRYDIKSPNCEMYKALYPEVLRLEGLRILKYADTMTKI